MPVRLAILWLGLLVLTLGADEKRDPAILKKIDEVTEAAIKKGDCPGAVVVVLHDNKVAYQKVFGNSQTLPEPAPMKADGIFDMASLTKPMATAAAIMLLKERGKISFDDPVSKHWPEFAANGKEKVTVEHLLIHTSGLIADNSVKDYEAGNDEAKRRIAALKLVQPPGSKFVYSDVGYITLGYLVEKISGESLDVFTRKNVFEPLGMKDTSFLPAKELLPRIVPTAKVGENWLRGVVHDPRARAMGGVAGHAGLFSTAQDVSIFATMLLNQGKHNGKAFLDEKTVRLFIEPVAVPGGFRSRGWDVDTAYSAPRGNLFAKKDGFGHTGFTGTALWVDVPSQTVVIILTNRVHLSDKTQVTTLRRQIGTIVAESLGKMPPAKSQ